MTSPDAWPLYNITEAALMARVEGGLLHLVLDEKTLEWIVPPVNAKGPTYQRAMWFASSHSSAEGSAFWLDSLCAP